MLVYASPTSPIQRNAGGVTPIQSLWETWALNEEDGRCILSTIAAAFYERVGPDDSILAGKEEKDARTALFNLTLSPYTTAQAYNKRAVPRPRNNSAAIWAKMILMSNAAYRAMVFTQQNCNRSNIVNPNKKEEYDATTMNPMHSLVGISCPPSAIAFAIR
eukprot:2472374-Ditylum_brightwellii.AAC.1